MTNPNASDETLALNWEGRGRPDDMPDLDWLVAMEEIRLLKARRDRYVDANDWDALEAVHAPDHVSYGPDGGVWTSAAEMIRNVKLAMPDWTIMHASFDAEIVFDTPTKARGIWAMIDSSVGHATPEGGKDGWKILFGYYYETYEKREGRWLFTSRRWHRHFGVTNGGIIESDERPKGAEGFSKQLR